MKAAIPIKIAYFALAIGPVWAQQTAAAPRPARSGYLSPAETPDVARIVPMAPTTGDSRDALDRAVFRATRSFEGSPRWSLALSDNDLSTAGMFRAFGCSLGVELTRQNAPRITALITRATIDGTAAFDRLKQLNQQRKRPFLVADGPICLKRPTGLEGNPDYPSGHTTFGWEVGLILAELAPDAATAILSRARAFGESRVVCGVHNASAVEAGRMTASAVVAALHGSAAFRMDLDAARSELAGLRGHVLGSAGCALEAEILAKPPY
jgi:acid phosphatase (class A)